MALGGGAEIGFHGSSGLHDLVICFLFSSFSRKKTAAVGCRAHVVAENRNLAYTIFYSAQIQSIEFNCVRKHNLPIVIFLTFGI
jgi:hypothetical protein